MTPEELRAELLGHPIALGTAGALLVRVRAGEHHTIEAIAEGIREVSGRTDILVVGLAEGEHLDPLPDLVTALAEHLQDEGLAHPEDGVFLMLDEAEWVSRTAFRWLMSGAGKAVEPAATDGENTA